MKINEYLKEQAQKISLRLNELLISDFETAVSKAMRYSAEGGGKRIRPILTVEFAKICGGNSDAALDFGFAPLK